MLSVSVSRDTDMEGCTRRPHLALLPWRGRLLRGLDTSTSSLSSFRGTTPQYPACPTVPSRCGRSRQLNATSDASKEVFPRRSPSLHLLLLSSALGFSPAQSDCEWTAWPLSLAFAVHRTDPFILELEATHHMKVTHTGGFSSV